MTNEDAKGLEPMSVSVEQRHQQASSRSNCYGLLALIFRDTPTSEVVAQFKSAPMVDALGFEVGEILAGELDEVTERLGEEYTSTFIGPGPHVSPYASTYHEDEGQLWGDSTVRVKRFIEATGLSFEANWASIPDHIAIELELMQRLSEYEAELWARCAAAPTLSDDNVDEQLRQCLEVQERFLLDHLCVWVSKF